MLRWMRSLKKYFVTKDMMEDNLNRTDKSTGKTELGLQILALQGMVWQEMT